MILFYSIIFDPGSYHLCFRYRDDPWMWDEDWKVESETKFYKKFNPGRVRFFILFSYCFTNGIFFSKRAILRNNTWRECGTNLVKIFGKRSHICRNFQSMFSYILLILQEKLLIFFRWYTNLCNRPPPTPETIERASGGNDLPDVEEGWGPRKITMQMRIAPKLLRMHYDGYPLYYYSDHGWGYLIPNEEPSHLDRYEKESEGRYWVTLAKDRKAVFPLG